MVGNFDLTFANFTVYLFMKENTEYNIFGGTIDNNNKRIYFWGGIFSQWYPSTIFDENFQVKVNCAEQLMMLYKAATFNDTETFNQILKTDNPAIQKSLGRKVKGYNDEEWSKVRLDIVTHISYLKFTQNEDLKNALLLSEDYEIVEASPYDCIWGVGLMEDDKLILDKKNWCKRTKTL